MLYSQWSRPWGIKLLSFCLNGTKPSFSSSCSVSWTAVDPWKCSALSTQIHSFLSCLHKMFWKVLWIMPVVSPFFATLLKLSQNSQELFKELSFLPCWSTLGVGVLFLTILSLSGVHEKQTNEGSCTHAQCLAQHRTDVWNPQIPRKLKHQHDKELGIWFHPLPLLVQLFVVTTCTAFTL